MPSRSDSAVPQSKWLSPAVVAAIVAGVFLILNSVINYALEHGAAVASASSTSGATQTSSTPAPSNLMEPPSRTLPVKVTFHYAEVGNTCFTVNAGRGLQNVATDCSHARDDLAGIYHGQTQEITIDWDETALASLGQRLDLTDEQLSFEYDCYYTNGAYSAKRGQVCGNEGTGEPLLRAFSMRLTGSRRDEFKLTYSCVGDNVYAQLIEGSMCKVDGWRGIGQLSMQIIANPRTHLIRRPTTLSNG